MKKMGSSSSDSIAYIGSLIGFIAFVKAILPEQSWEILTSLLLRFLSWSSSKTRIKVNELVGYENNELYKVVDLHVGSLARSKSVERLELSKLKNRGQPSFSLADEEKVEDLFQGESFTWIHQSKLRKGEMHYRYDDMRRSYTLVMDKSLKNTLLQPYLEHITKHAEELKHKNKRRMLYTNYGPEPGFWKRTAFDHPATMESIAMDPELKEKLKSDLVAFMGGEKYFRRIGRAWKRGYLLYGPPGTGKTSLIAAIAHFTDYNIYDLELTNVKSNSDLREYLSKINSKSIVVIEDIDCSVDLKKRALPAPPPPPEKKPEEESGGESSGAKESEKDQKSRVTLSGLLNFTDGLWSSTGSERIIIFTTNHIDQLDPALIRTGRMDMHICMGFCGFAAFRVLARTHLEIEEHELFPRIEELLGEVEITPADISEIFIEHRQDSDKALQILTHTLETRKNKIPAPEDFSLKP